MAYDIKQWQEKSYPFVGLIPNPPDRSTSNGLLFTATAILLGFDLYADLTQCAAACRNPDGTYNRYPGIRDIEAQDDLIGISGVAPCYANRIYDAMNLFGYYDNTGTSSFKPGAILGRIAGFMPFIKYGTGRELNIFDQLGIALGLVWVVFDKPADSSGKCLDFIKIRTLRNRYWLINQAAKFWWSQIRKQNGSMAAVYALYFTTPGHPIPLRAKELGL